MMTKGVPALPLPRVPSGQSLSALTMPDWAPEIDRGSGPIVPFHQSLFLCYGNAYGESSRRRITTRSLRRWNDDDVAIWAWCHEHDATRTFLASRVTGLSDLETSEAYPSPGAWLVTQYEEWPEVRDEIEHQRLLREIEEERRRELIADREAEAREKREAAERLRLGRLAVLCLVYVAKADGRMDAKERHVIFEFVDDLEIFHDTPLGWADVKGRLKKLTCDQEEFLVSMKKLRQAPHDLRERIVSTARELMLEDDEEHPQEHRAVSWLRVMMQVA